MANYTIYHLRFRSPLRVGERGVGLEVTRPYVPADTLFSAVCSAWRELYGAGDLVQEIFANNAAAPPFFLSSAFPFAGPVRFFPKPIARLRRLELPEKNRKAFKRIQFVSEAIFAKLIAAQAMTFSKTSACNQGSVWFDPQQSPDQEVIEAENAKIQNTASKADVLAPFWDAEQNSYIFWRVQVRPRVRLDRINSTSDIWHIGSVHFRDDCGLWSAVEFGEQAGLRPKFEACLRWLGDTGLGGERGGGYGLFNWTSDPKTTLPSVDNANAFMTLSPFCPRDESELARLAGGAPSYEIITRRGWIASPEGSTLRRKTIWMFGEGAIFSDSGSPRPGALVDVTPEIWEGGKKHSVYRYGYAFPIGFHHEVPS